jgi:hypothetical protein
MAASNSVQILARRLGAHPHVSVGGPEAWDWTAASGVLWGLVLLLAPAAGAGRGAVMKKPGAAESASALIDARIEEFGDWRGKTLAKVRAIIRGADPGIVEEWKWTTPVWSRGGIVCTGEVYKKVVKLTFAKGAALKDPSRLFNSSLDGKVRRAIDIHEGDKIDEAALKDLIRAAVALNVTIKGNK